MSETKLLSRHQVAEMFGVHANTVSRWASQGIIPAPIRVCQTLRWRSEDIHKLTLGTAVMCATTPVQLEVLS